MKMRAFPVTYLTTLPSPFPPPHTDASIPHRVCAVSSLKALGRCICHLFDYGVICLIDDRYLNERRKLNLASWVRDRPCDFRGFTEVGDTMNKVRDEM